MQESLRLEPAQHTKLNDRDCLNAPILVLGVPRSGTSLIAGCLALCGAWVGRTVAGGRHNPKGFFENLTLRDGVNKQILQRLGCDPLGVRKLPELGKLPNIENLKTAIGDIVHKEGRVSDQRWLFKDAKLTLLWPVYQRSFPNARWIIVRRDEDSIVASCLRTSFMRQHSGDPEYWRAWVREYETRLTALKESKANWNEIWPNDLIVNRNLEPLRSLVHELGLQWDEDKVLDFVTPSFWQSPESPKTSPSSRWSSR